MTASNAAKRNTSKPAAKLAPVAATTDWQRVEFGRRLGSNLSALLEIGRRLPMVRYDRARLGTVMNLDPQGKSALLEDLSNLMSGLNNTIAQIGMLMSGQDKTSGRVGHEELVSIGFTIEGLAGLAEDILYVREELEEAEPIGAGAAELERTVSHG